MVLKARQTADRSVCQTTRMPLPVPVLPSSAVRLRVLPRSSVHTFVSLALAVQALRMFHAAIASGFADRAFARLLELWGLLLLLSASLWEAVR